MTSVAPQGLEGRRHSTFDGHAARPRESGTPQTAGSALQQNQGPRVQSLMKLGQMLNGSPRVAAQATLARAMNARDRTAPQSDALEGPSPPAHAFAAAPAAGAAAQLTSKDSIEPPDDPSDVVPDLTPELVDQITAATTPGKRKQVLKALLAYLAARGAVDDPNKTRLRYGDEDNRNAAVTKAEGMEDHDPVRITVYRNAFASPSILYSVLRHELIHVGQRLNVADDGAASMQDEFMHENIYDELGQKTRLTLQLPLQEIETHVWELDHAGETGIGQEYRIETVTQLVHYVNRVVAAIGREDVVSDKAYDYWMGYIYKAKMMLDNCVTGSDALGEARQDLDDAIEAREQRILNHRVGAEAES